MIDLVNSDIVSQDKEISKDVNFLVEILKVRLQKQKMLERSN